MEKRSLTSSDKLVLLGSVIIRDDPEYGSTECTLYLNELIDFFPISENITTKLYIQKLKQ
jgi:hypothetical protein